MIGQLLGHRPTVRSPSSHCVNYSSENARCHPLGVEPCPIMVVRHCPLAHVQAVGTWGRARGLALACPCSLSVGSVLLLPVMLLLHSAIVSTYGRRGSSQQPLHAQGGKLHCMLDIVWAPLTGCMCKDPCPVSAEKTNMLGSPRVCWRPLGLQGDVCFSTCPGLTRR